MSEANQLRRQFRFFKQPRGFREGDVIICGEGMLDPKRPTPRNPVVVMEVLAEPIIDAPNDLGRYDLIIGKANADGWFDLAHADSRRFQYFDEVETPN